MNTSSAHLRDERGWRTAFFIFTGVVCLACAAPQPREPRPVPQSRDTYEFHWNGGQDQAPSVGLTVAVVRPHYADQDSALSEPGYRKFAKGFAKSAGVDLDKVLVGKGCRVSGPHESWDDITYPDKQSADLALTPKIFLTTVVKYDRDRSPGGAVSGGRGGKASRASSSGGSRAGNDGIVPNDGAVDWVERPVFMSVQGFVAFELREPLSNQKLWVKKLELEPEDTRTIECYEAEPILNSEGWTTGYRAGKLLYDGKQDALADLMEKWYPEIMSKARTYLNTEEMLNMKPQVEEIRKNKRY